MDWGLIRISPLHPHAVGDILTGGWRVTASEGDWLHLERVAARATPIAQAPTPACPMIALPNQTKEAA